MKWIIVTTLVLLAGCAAQVVPSLADDPDQWQAFGQKHATEGHIAQPKQKLSEHALSGQVTAEAYQAYLTGYEVGRASYCQQDARLLAKTGKPYRGICDELDPFFRSDYNTYRYESM